MGKVYNIYSGNIRINKNPLTKDEIDKIYEKSFVYKNINDKNVKIDLKDTVVRECIVI